MRPTSGLVGRASKNSLNGCFYAAMSAQSNIFQKRGLSERVKNICDCRGAEGDNPEGEAVVNDDLNGRQSRRTDRSIFTAVKMQDREVQIPPPQPTETRLNFSGSNGFSFMSSFLPFVISKSSCFLRCFVSLLLVL